MITQATRLQKPQDLTQDLARSLRERVGATPEQMGTRAPPADPPRP